MTDSQTPTSIESLAQRLVRIESENPPGNERACAEFIYEWFCEHGFDPELVTDPDPQRPQVGLRVGTGDPTLVLNGHTDVVPAGDHEEWTHDPYDGIVEDGRLYGRGSADMKTGLAIAMATVRDVAPAVRSGALSGSVVFHAAMGEETAAPGTRSLLEAGYDGDVAVVLEPTEFKVATSTKGLACYELVVGGESTHAAHPDQGRNAIDGIASLRDAIASYDDQLRQRDDLLCGNAYATITEIEAGTDSNLAVIPDRARLVLDRRVLPAETLASVDEEIEDIVRSVEATTNHTLEWRRIQHYASSEVPADHPLASLFREQSAAVVDAPQEPWGMKAATDMRTFVNEFDTPAITWGPGSLDQAHTVDEGIDIADATAGYDILERATRTLLE